MTRTASTASGVFAATARTIFAGCLILACVGAGARAQNTTASDGSTPLALSAGAPAGSYALSDFDNVNLFNGNLNFHLPLVHVGGRGGARHTLTLPIEQHWTVRHFENDYQEADYPQYNVWYTLKPGYGPGVLAGRQVNGGNCNFQTREFNTQSLTRLSFVGPDGTEYELRDKKSGGQPKTSTCPYYSGTNNGYNREKVFVTADGTSVTFVSDADIYDFAAGPASPARWFPEIFYPSGVLMFRDGTRYRIDSGKVSWIRDRNGNKLTFQNNGPGGRVSLITDSLGRTVSFSYADFQTVFYDQISFSGFGGTPRTIRIYYDTLEHRLRTNRPGDQSAVKTFYALFQELNGSASTNFNPYVVSSVVLPNSQQYQFLYNVYGELARVTLPTGGAFEYDFGNGILNDLSDGVVSSLVPPQIYRRVLTKRTYTDAGNTLDGIMTYSRPEGSPYSYVEVDRLKPDGATLLARTRHYFHGGAAGSLGQDGFSYPDWRYGKEYQTEVMDTNGSTVLRRVEQTWQQRAPVSWWTLNPDWAPPNDPRVTETLTTLVDANLVTKQTFTYSADLHNNVTDTYEYDYGVGAAPPYATRHTHVDYIGVNPSNGINYADPANGVDYTANDVHLRGLPRARQVYSVNTSNGAETLVAQGETKYDEPTFPLFTYAEVTGWSDPGSAARGNPTTARSWLDTSNTWLEAHAQYDQAGNVRNRWDARDTALLYPTQIDYADSFADGNNNRKTYALPKTVTSPPPDPGNTGFGSNTGFATTNVYDYATGLPVSSTDVANNKTTSLSYADDQGNLDPLDRLKKVTHPDGGRTTYTYVDAHQCGAYVEARTLHDASGRELASWQFHDGLGRPYLSETYEGQDAVNIYLRVDTQYDAMGRAWRVSDQYRSSGCTATLNPSGRWTEKKFDGLGRVKEVKTTADNALVTTSYAGNTATVTEPTGKKRKSVTDALGRLKEVYEDPLGYNYLTSYTYNALGNLRTVTQGTQPARVFTYDSLSRLTSASNPESGTVGYTYDANGNLQTRTDARGVTATYAYDRLNRNITITYTNDPAQTPTAYHHYDNPTAAANGLGRFWWSSAGTSATGVNGYDAVGRISERHQNFLNNGVWSADYSVSLTYNKAGGVATQSYPSGRTVTYNYDAAGRPGDYNGQPAVSGNLGDSVTRTYDSELRYHEMGGMEQERFGTDTAVYNKSFYNGRNQLAEIRVSTYSILSSGNETNWNRGAIINHYSNSGWGASGGGSDNNGNLKKQEVYIPNDDAISGYFNVVQYYGYDALNRLSSVEDKPFNGSPDFYQAYTYDRWGNRTVNAGGTWNAPASQYTASGTTNRLAPPAGYTMTYDAAGNLTFDDYAGAGTRAYDAENRMTTAQDFYGQTSTYTYDADGRRVRRRVANGAEVWQIYGIGGELVAEYAAGSSTTTPQKEYGYRGGELLVQATAPVSTGTGLTASYFDNMNFTNLKIVRTEASVNFDWGGGSPHSTIGVDTFTARWEGKVEPLYTQTYTFYTVTDDGVRLWVNGQLVIDKWIDQAPTEWSGQIALTAGQRYDIRMEFYENGGGAMAKLLWSSASQAKTVIAQSQLYPATAANGAVDFEWMVYDQLGTPRMVIDKSGSLARVKRHDYLPFGEEIGADLTWRTTGRGYVGDNVRQHFTGYERDSETGLDYAQARYFASAQGRFTSADPLLASGRAGAPQTWNRYSYALNNPLKYTDPTGMVDEGDNSGAPQPTPAPAPPPVDSALPGSPDFVEENPIPAGVQFYVPKNEFDYDLYEGIYWVGARSIAEVTVVDESGVSIDTPFWIQEDVTGQLIINGQPQPTPEVHQQPGITTVQDNPFSDYIGISRSSTNPIPPERVTQTQDTLARNRFESVQTQTLTIMTPGRGVALTVVTERRVVGSPPVRSDSRGHPIPNYSTTLTIKSITSSVIRSP
jgi:RHS repeat-associated protein